MAPNPSITTNIDVRFAGVCAETELQLRTITFGLLGRGVFLAKMSPREADRENPSSFSNSRR